MDWQRDEDGYWLTTLDGGRRYVIRGGPGAWWFELLNARGATLATGRVWGDTGRAKAEAEARER